MKSLITSFATLCVLALPAAALDLDNMTDQEREIFREEVRSYLLDHPEVLEEAIDALKSKQRLEQATLDKRNIEDFSDEIFNDTHSWVGGNPEGDITLVEFTDYRCGYCRRAFSEVNDLVETDGNIRLVIKEFPILGEQSELSSRFAIATLQLAGPEKYKEAHDALITLRSDLNAASVTRLAESLELDAEKIAKHMASEDVTAVIRNNRALAENMQISGTPTFIVKNEMLRGYVPLADMQLIIEELRAN